MKLEIIGSKRSKDGRREVLSFGLANSHKEYLEKIIELKKKHLEWEFKCRSYTE